MSHSSSISSPSSTNSDEIVYQNINHHQLMEAHSVISFKPGYEYNNFMNNTGSLLSFHKNEHIFQTCYPRISHQDQYYSIWEDNLSHGHHNQFNPRCSADGPLPGNFNCIKTSSSHGSTSNNVKENQHEGEPFEWLYLDEMAPTEDIQELGSKDPCFLKRPHIEESMQPLKKQCNNTSTRKPKSKSSAASKDPQSVAAKNRRERISERLKILQDLVPNGSKVDLVTMLEKAISYVKFLQLQVKVLATDEFWPVQGEKGPELSQVKETIDAILASQRDRISSSN